MSARVLLEAARNGDIDEISRQLDKQRKEGWFRKVAAIDVNTFSNCREPGLWTLWTALMVASYYNQEEAVRLLLRRGADVNVKVKCLE